MGVAFLTKREARRLGKKLDPIVQLLLDLSEDSGISHFTQRSDRVVTNGGVMWLVIVTLLSGRRV